MPQEEQASERGKDDESVLNMVEELLNGEEVGEEGAKQLDEKWQLSSAEELEDGGRKVLFVAL